MKSMLKIVASTLFLLSASSTPLFSQFYTFQTEHLRLIYYSKGHEYIVPHLANCFENALRFHRKLFDYTPSEKVTLILQDFGDYAGGGANTVPFNLIGIGIAPFNYTYETMAPLERMSMMMNHELAHIVTMDKPSPSDRFFRSLFFGKVSPIADAPTSMLYSYLTSPRWNSPRWFIEGSAVFMETWMGGGLGRALGAYDEMVFRTMVRDNSYFYDVVGLESEGTKVDFQVGANSYLYGTRFISYLALQYGTEKLLSWIGQNEESSGYFASQFRKVYGATLDEEWSRWIEWEHQWQRANLDSVRLNSVTSFQSLSAEPLGSVSRAFYDPVKKKVYAAINYPGQSAHVASIDFNTGTIEKIHDVRGAAIFYVSSLAHDPESKKIFYTTDNNQWRDLFSLDLTTGKARMLQKDIRTGDLAFNRKDNSLWGVRHLNGYSTIVRIPLPYDDWNSIYTWDYGKDMFDIDISPDGRMLTGALTLIDGTQLLVKMDLDSLMGGSDKYEVLFNFENSTPSNFVFSDDGKHLFGNSYYSGVSNIVRYDFDTRQMNWITNAESGFFRPVPISADSLIAFHFTGKGFVPVLIANKPVEHVSRIRYLGQEVVTSHPLLMDWNLPPPSSINLDTMIVSTDSYDALASVRLASAYPIVEGFKDYPAYGFRFNFADPVMFHNIDVTASYSPNRLLPAAERLHATFNYKLLQWRLNGNYNGADFYDLFGPTKLSRKGYSLGIEYKQFLIFDEPEMMDYKVRLSGYGGLERLPDFQNVSTSFEKFYSLNARLNYEYLGKSLGAVDHEKGISGHVSAHTNYVNDNVFPRFWADLAYGFLLPINHSSIWFRGFGGFSLGSRKEPFANFYFGGFGNNWVDHQAIRRYREDYSFPGIELNSVGGTNFGKAMIEWNLPPIRFRRLGFSTLYCNWARIALFSSAIVTNLDSSPERRSLANVGGQIDFRLVIFSSLESTLSFGYAVGAERNHRSTNEFMISLKIL